jgi:hypothetical protein
MSRLPNSAAVATLELLTSRGRFLPGFMLGLQEAAGDVTTSPPYNTGPAWIENYDSGREIGRAALGLD